MPLGSHDHASGLAARLARFALVASIAVSATALPRLALAADASASASAALEDRETDRMARGAKATFGFAAGSALGLVLGGKRRRKTSASGV